MTIRRFRKTRQKSSIILQRYRLCNDLNINTLIDTSAPSAKAKPEALLLRKAITRISVRGNANMSNERRSAGNVIIEEKGADPDDIIVTEIRNDEGQQKSGFDEIASSVKEVAQKTGEALNKATESIGKAIESALSARDHVVMVRVNDDSLKSLDALVQSGIFKSRSESAAFLISEGVKAQATLFERISERIAEIERLRSELKGIVQTPADS